jgi:hypothetical protein
MIMFCFTFVFCFEWVMVICYLKFLFSFFYWTVELYVCSYFHFPFLLFVLTQLTQRNDFVFRLDTRCSLFVVCWSHWTWYLIDTCYCLLLCCSMFDLFYCFILSIIWCHVRLRLFVIGICFYVIVWFLLSLICDDVLFCFCVLFCFLCIRDAWLSEW